MFYCYQQHIPIIKRRQLIDRSKNLHNIPTLRLLFPRPSGKPWGSPNSGHPLLTHCTTEMGFLLFSLASNRKGEVCFLSPMSRTHILPANPAGLTRESFSYHTLFPAGIPEFCRMLTSILPSNASQAPCLSDWHCHHCLAEAGVEK